MTFQPYSSTTHTCTHTNTQARTRVLDKHTCSSLTFVDVLMSAFLLCALIYTASINMCTFYSFKNRRRCSNCINPYTKAVNSTLNISKSDIPDSPYTGIARLFYLKKIYFKWSIL